MKLIKKDWSTATKIGALCGYTVITLLLIKLIPAIIATVPLLSLWSCVMIMTILAFLAAAVWDIRTDGEN